MMLVCRRVGGFLKPLAHTEYVRLLSKRPVTLANNTLQRSRLSTDSSVLPRVASPSLWQSLVPKALRPPSDPVAVAERQKAKQAKAQRSKEWNPATFFIVMFLLIGSNAIQLISLRNRTLSFSRKTEAKIALLREVIGRVQNGEDVDVEGMLGTGNPEQEKEWEEGW